MRISVSSICSGVAPITRANWVSVCTFFGMRLRSPICSGRMSWRSAVSSDITITPSRRSTSWAGRVAGILIGMGGRLGSGERLDRRAARRGQPRRFAGSSTQISTVAWSKPKASARRALMRRRAASASAPAATTASSVTIGRFSVIDQACRWRTSVTSGHGGGEVGGDGGGVEARRRGLEQDVAAVAHHASRRSGG